MALCGAYMEYGSESRGVWNMAQWMCAYSSRVDLWNMTLLLEVYIWSFESGGACATWDGGVWNMAMIVEVCGICS